MDMWKIVLGVAGGVVLAWIAIAALSVASAVAPSAGGFMGAVFADTGFQVVALIVVVVGGYYYFVVRRTGRWL